MNIFLCDTHSFGRTVGLVVYTLSLSSSHHRCIEFTFKVPPNKDENLRTNKKVSPFFHTEWSRKTGKKLYIQTKRKYWEKNRWKFYFTKRLNSTVVGIFFPVWPQKIKTTCVHIRHPKKYGFFSVDFVSVIKKWNVFANYTSLLHCERNQKSKLICFPECLIKSFYDEKSLSTIGVRRQQNRKKNSNKNKQPKAEYKVDVNVCVCSSEWCRLLLSRCSCYLIGKIDLKTFFSFSSNDRCGGDSAASAIWLIFCLSFWCYTTICVPRYGVFVCLYVICFAFKKWD